MDICKYKFFLIALLSIFVFILNQITDFWTVYIPIFHGATGFYFGTFLVLLLSVISFIWSLKEGLSWFRRKKQDENIKKDIIFIVFTWIITISFIVIELLWLHLVNSGV
ncbi:hypothetical protein AN619_27980 [Thermotalea metallivorans]|uniref:Uncharacterized protein n=1 Tax=Thermotalea metallivorans TaxID=520762 RepID=A0A140L003_9FIRM|nr:hypothetical protein AN619_27980 [Thermotalea metallivorans]